MYQNVSILATSCKLLNVPGETTWQVTLTRCEKAMQRFIERAIVVHPEFKLDKADEALLIQKVDGLSLAIELAAARLWVLSLEQIAAQLDDCFSWLTFGNRLALPKHAYHMGRIYDFLSQAKRGLLRRLSIFTTDWTLELAEAVWTWALEQGAAQPRGDRAHLRWEDVRTHLVNKFLVIVDERGAHLRYSLSNTIRQYAQEKLI